MWIENFLAVGANMLTFLGLLLMAAWAFTQLITFFYICFGLYTKKFGGDRATRIFLPFLWLFSLLLLITTLITVSP